MMKNVLAASALALALCTAVQGEENVGKTVFTLERAKEIALRDNPSLGMAQARINAAIAGVIQARSEYWPTLDVSAGATKYRDQPARPSRDYDNNTRYSLSAGVEWTLFDGFQRKYKLLLAQYGLSEAEHSWWNARRLLLSAVSSAYFSALQYRDNMNIAREDADFNKILLEDARKRLEGGIAKSSEVLNFTLQLQKADVDYITAEKNWRVSMIALCSLLAISDDVIWENYVLEQPENPKYELATFQELFSCAMGSRPDLLSVESKIQIARDGIEAARNTWYPELKVFADYGFMRTDSAKFHHDMDRSVTAGVSLNWTVFNGFKTSAQIMQAKEELANALKEREDMLIEIEAEIRRDMLNIESSGKQLELQDKVLSTAREIRELVHEEYLGGTTTITRLNEAQSDVVKAASARSAALMQLLNSIESLNADTGANIIGTIK